MGNETSADNNTTPVIATTLSPEEQAKADEMLKLQQKITQEILNSNLKQKEMNELQVNTWEKKEEEEEVQCAALKRARNEKTFPIIFRILFPRL